MFEKPHRRPMDECRDCQGRELPGRYPYSLRGFMEKHFYGLIKHKLSVLIQNRNWLNANNILDVKEKIEEVSIDFTYGVCGQNVYTGYNRTRRHPFIHITIEDLRNSTIHIQESNIDTRVALVKRTFGSAYQFVPPISVTLGLKECLSSKKVRFFIDTGSWKQTAPRRALFSPLISEYAITIRQGYPMYYSQLLLQLVFIQSAKTQIGNLFFD